MGTTWHDPGQLLDRLVAAGVQFVVMVGDPRGGLGRLVVSQRPANLSVVDQVLGQVGATLGIERSSEVVMSGVHVRLTRYSPTLAVAVSAGSGYGAGCSTWRSERPARRTPRRRATPWFPAAPTPRSPRRCQRAVVRLGGGPRREPATATAW